MVISQTPLRISLVGGGTDLKEYYSIRQGKVISTAIDKFIYVVIKKRYDDLIVIHYTDNEICHKVDDIKHDLIRESLKLVGITKSIEIATFADIPSQGSGLWCGVQERWRGAQGSHQGQSAGTHRCCR